MTTMPKPIQMRWNIADDGLDNNCDSKSTKIQRWMQVFLVLMTMAMVTVVQRM